MQVKNVFRVFPKETSDAPDNVFLGYFDVAEHVSNIISSPQDLFGVIWVTEKDSASKNGVFWPFWGLSKGNVPKMA